MPLRQEHQNKLSRISCNAIYHLRAVKIIELKLFKATNIKVAYAKRAMSKYWRESQIHYATLSSLWADLGLIMMDVVTDLSSDYSAELGFINAIPSPVIF